MKQGFDNQKYLTMQSEHIKERISHFGDKLYLEFGGKLFDDYHASRVLPGFAPDSKLKMLLQLSDQAEIVIVISAADIEKNKIRADLGITYDADVLRLIQNFKDKGLYVGSVTITQYSGQRSADKFKEKLEKSVYVLISLDLEKNRVSTSFEPEISDYRLREELKKESEIRDLIDHNIDNDISEEEKIKIRINYNNKEEEIIKDSNNQLSKLSNLVKKLANLSGLKEGIKNYKENIKIIYESFGEVLLYLLEDINLSKIKNKKMELERILRNCNNYSDNLIDSYLNFDEKLNHIKDNKKLKDLICHLIIAEEEKGEKKFQNYLRKDPNFLEFLKNLIDKRNVFSHSEEDSIINTDEEKFEYNFELEAKKKLYEFIEKIFDFKFEESTINFITIDEVTENQIREISNKKINNEFSDVIISKVRNELLETRIFFEYYKSFKSQIYKALFMNRVAVLLEANMQLVRKSLDKVLEIEEIKN